jgi:pimeloyl-ACP methyl ester carboxylesterase
LRTIGADTVVPRKQPMATTWTRMRPTFAEVTKALDLKDAVHIGHSTGGGEVIRYVAKYGKGRVAKAELISSIPLKLLKSKENPDGLPLEVFRSTARRHRISSCAVLSRHHHAVLWIQSARREDFTRYSRQLVAAGNEGQRAGAL